MMFSVLRRLTGVEVLEDLSEFFQAFSGMVGGFRERAKRVNELLANPETCFLVVCAPQGEPITEAVYFHRKLVEAELPFGGVIVNKVHYECELPAVRRWRPGERLAEALDDEDLARRVVANFDDYRALAARDLRNIKRLTAEMRARLVIQVPYLDTDVHDLAGPHARSTTTCSRPARASAPRSPPRPRAEPGGHEGPPGLKPLFLGDRRRKLLRQASGQEARICARRRRS